MTFKNPGGSSYPLSLEGLTVRPTYGTPYQYIVGTTGSETVLISKCRFDSRSIWNISQCDVVIIQSVINKGNSTYAISASKNANVTCINSILAAGVSYSSTGKYDLQNCFIEGKLDVAYSSIKNCIISALCTVNETNTTSHCLVKEGSEGFADSWYIKAVAPDPGPWDEPDAVVLWDNLFTGNYHLTDEASQTYIGTNGTEVGVYGGTYPYEKTPDYPVVKSLDVIGSHKDGKLNVQINVE